MDVAILNLIIQGGSFALVVMLVYWGVVKMLPSRDKEFIDEIKQARSEYREDLRHCRDYFQMALDKLLADDKAARSEYLTQIQALAAEIKAMAAILRSGPQ